MSEPGIEHRIKYGAIWENKLGHTMKSWPGVKDVVHHPFGDKEIDFDVVLVNGEHIYVDAKSDKRKDTLNHSIQANLPVKYSRQFPRRCVIIWDDGTAIFPEKIIEHGYDVRPGTLIGRTPMMLIPKSDCMGIEEVQNKITTFINKVTHVPRLS